MIPPRFTCDDLNINPPLEIRKLPLETRSLMLLVEDPDATGGTWLHWLVWNVPVRQHIKENSVPGIEGMNDFNLHHYGGPCPPSGTHRYFFKVFALDVMLDIPHNASKEMAEKAREGHVVAYGEIMGLYKRRTADDKNLSPYKKRKATGSFFISEVF